MSLPRHPGPLAREGFDGGLVAALLPVILHKLSNATQLLASLNGLLALEGGAELALSRADDLARASTQIEELGWLLAALASASGANLLMERRERRGLELFLRVLRDALRRQGLEFSYPADTLPELSSRALAGWELPWALSVLVHQAVRQGHAGGGLVLACERVSAPPGICFRATGSAASGELHQQMLARLPGAEILRRGEQWELRAPAEWFSSEQA